MLGRRRRGPSPRAVEVVARGGVGVGGGGGVVIAPAPAETGGVVEVGMTTNFSKTSCLQKYLK